MVSFPPPPPHGLFWYASYKPVVQYGVLISHHVIRDCDDTTGEHFCYKNNAFLRKPAANKEGVIEIHQLLAV